VLRNPGSLAPGSAAPGSAAPGSAAPGSAAPSRPRRHAPLYPHTNSKFKPTDN